MCLFNKYCYVFSGLHPLDFSKEVKPQPKDEGGIDERFWEIIMSADRKDYERICLEFGVKDLRLILKKLEQKKQEREEEQCKVGLGRRIAGPLTFTWASPTMQDTFILFILFII